MPMNPELMKVIAGGAGKTGAPPPGGMPPPATPGAPVGAPVGAPMTTPQPNEGQQQAAMVDISMALDLLEKSLAPFGAESEQGRALMDALQKLSKVFGEQREKAKPLQQAELMQLMSSLPGAGGASPEMKGMAGPPPGAGGGMPQPMAA